MIRELGYCSGIENYSRYLSGRNVGEPPPCLFDYVPDNAVLIIDESHVTVPQLGGMYKGDFARKSTLSEFGFRLPSCIDNRPLKFEEWEMMRPETVFVSATPGPWELERTANVLQEAGLPCRIDRHPPPGQGEGEGLALYVRDEDRTAAEEAIHEYRAEALPDAADFPRAGEVLDACPACGARLEASATACSECER